jgi:hypothetical protein
MIYSFGVDNILQNLVKVGWYFVPIVGIWIFVYICNAVAWRFIINEPEIPFTNILSITISGYSLNYMTPFFHLGGEPYRIIVLKDLLGITKAVSVTISYLMLHFLSSFLIWITAAIIILLIMPLSILSYCFFTLSLLVFGYVVFLFIKGYKNGVTKSFAAFLVKLPLLNKYVSKVESKDAILTDIDENTKELYRFRKQNFLAANFFEYLSRVISTFEFYFILKAVGLNPTLLETFIINAGLGLIANMFFIVPFELGVKEGGLYAVLGFLNYTPSMGIFVGIVNRLRELFWILIGLLLILISTKKSPNRKLKNILYDESNII